MAERTEQVIRSRSRWEVPKRFIVVSLCFWGVLTFFALRLNISVAIVAMVTSRSQQNSSHGEECLVIRNHSMSEDEAGEFSWDPQTQGFVLGGYYYGYLISQLPGGLIATRIGGKRPFGFGLLAMSILTLVTPTVSRLDVYGLVVLRACLGLVAGVAYLGIHVILAKWAPCQEKSRISAFVFAAITSP